MLLVKFMISVCLVFSCYAENMLVLGIFVRKFHVIQVDMPMLTNNWKDTFIRAKLEVENMRNYGNIHFSYS